MKVKSLSRVRLLATPGTAAYQAPLSMGFSRQEYWNGVPLPSPSSTVRGCNYLLAQEVEGLMHLAFAGAVHLESSTAYGLLRLAVGSLTWGLCDLGWTI